MKTFEKYTELVERARTLTHTCDFCLKDMTKQNPKEKESEIIDTYDWEGVGYGPIAHIIVEIRLSNSYPECGNSKEISLDVCSKCFKLEILDRAKFHTLVESDW